MRLLTVHWCLDPEKNDGLYVVEDGEKKAVTPEQAYAGFLRGIMPRSKWFDKEERRVFRMGKGQKFLAEQYNIDYVGSGALVCDEGRLKDGFLQAREPIRKVTVDTEAWFKACGNEKLRKKKIYELIDMLLVDSPNGEIWIFEEPDPKTPFAGFIDSSECLTTGADHAAAAFTNCLTGQVACGARGRWQPDQLAVVASVLGYFYNEAFLGIEFNSVGMAVLTSITGRIALRPEDDEGALKKSWMYQRLATEWVNDKESPRKTRRLGLRTNSLTKRQLVTVTRRYMEHRPDFCPDRRFWDEALGFIEMPDGSVGNPSGDDFVIAVMGSLLTCPEARVFPPIPLRTRSQEVADWKEFYRYAKKGQLDKIRDKFRIEVPI